MRSLVTIILLLAVFQAGFPQRLNKSETISVNGHSVYYEVYGSGEPLFLLHGYTLSSKSWASFIDEYSKHFEVYVVDLQGHGKSGMFKENLSITSVSKDLDELINYLKLTSINGIGFSYGGDVLFQLEILHPGLIKSMITIGACGIWDATKFPNWIESLSYKNIENLKWMYEHQISEQQIKLILDQLPNYKCDMTEGQIKNIKTNTLLVLGDKDDGIPLESLAKVKKNLTSSYVWILPNTGHDAHYGKNKDQFISTSLAFLKGEWAMK